MVGAMQYVGRHAMGGACLFLFSMVLPIGAAGQEYAVDQIDGPPPSEELADAIRDRLAPEGLRVRRGEKRTICEIWPCKQWAVESGFEATEEVLYPFRPGSLFGVIRFRRRGRDFRDQRLARGVYTLRYARQPVDGNHEGTSPTRDFLLLVRAEEDRSVEPIEEEALSKASAEAAESNHPAMLCLQSVDAAADPSQPTLRHDEARDWWILQFSGTAVDGEKRAPLPVAVVVVGHADE